MQNKLTFAPTVLRIVRHIIIGIIDFFHIPFERWIPQQTFRYLACGGFNVFLDTLLYFISYNYILDKQPVHLDFLTIQPYTAAFMMSFTISFPLGFVLSKYIVFPHSNTRGRVQLFRYALIVLTCILLNYVFLKIFVELCHFYPTPSRVLTAGIVAIFSYISQRHFTFKTIEEELQTMAPTEEEM